MFVTSISLLLFAWDLEINKERSQLKLHIYMWANSIHIAHASFSQPPFPYQSIRYTHDKGGGDKCTYTLKLKHESYINRPYRIPYQIHIKSIRRRVVQKSGCKSYINHVKSESDVRVVNKNKKWCWTLGYTFRAQQLQADIIEEHLHPVEKERIRVFKRKESVFSEEEKNPCFVFSEEQKPCFPSGMTIHRSQWRFSTTWAQEKKSWWQKGIEWLVKESRTLWQKLTHCNDIRQSVHSHPKSPCQTQ